MAVAVAALLAAPAPERGSFRGDVAIETIGESAIAVYVDTNDNDSFDQRFLLEFENTSIAAPRHRTAFEAERDPDTLAERSPRADENERAPWPLYLASAHVEFAPGYLRVLAPASAFEFVVNGAHAPVWNPEGIRVWRRSGYGLSHTVAESGIPIGAPGRPRSVSADYCDASASCDPGDTDDGGGWGGGGTITCHAGGVGSTSCTVSSGGTSCSVTCTTGYYACCENVAGLPKCRLEPTRAAADAASSRSPRPSPARP